MKFKALLATLVLIIAVAAPAFAQYGETDTLIVMTTRPDVLEDDSTFAIELWLWHDEPVSGVNFGMTWNLDGMQAVSASSPAAVTSVWNSLLYWEGGSMATSNANKRFVFLGVGLFGGDIPANTTRELIATWNFTLTGWDGTSVIELDTNQFDASAQPLVLTEQDQIAPFIIIPKLPLYVRDPSDANSSTGDNLPTTFSLSQNYPNPFNPATKISFTMPAAVDYDLTVYNVVGQVVKEFNGKGTVGVNTVTWDASANASGIYFYKLKAGDFTETKKMALVK